MDIMQAMLATQGGKAVSRKAWGDRDRVVHFAGEFGTDGFQAVGGQDFTQADLQADDWFVVAAIN